MNKGVIFVAIQVVLFGVYVFDNKFFAFDINEIFQQIGLGVGILGALIIIVAILQLNKNLSPFPKPKADGELIKNGLYAFVRHPIYTGIILGSIGYGIYTESWWKLFVGCVLYLLFHFKAKYEEELLKNHFEEYDEYMIRTGMFFPKF